MAFTVVANSTSGFGISLGGGGAYTLTCLTGSYTLSGQAAGLYKSKLVVASAGAYTYSGISASLLRSKRIVATAGTYTYSGISANLLRSKRIVATAGAYTLTGVDVTLLRAKYIQAQTGSYVLSGQNAVLTWTGGAVNYTLTCLAGSYGLTGQSANLLKSKTIVANTGAYTYTGVTVNLLRSKVLVANAGAYTLTGNSATLTKASAGNYVLTCLSGSYTLTGSNATLTYSGQQQAGGGVPSRRKTKRFYVDGEPYDVPIDEIEYFLSNLPDVEQEITQEAPKKHKTVEIRAVGSNGQQVSTFSKPETSHFEAFKALIFKQIELPSFDFAQLEQFERERQQKLLMLEALEDRAQQEYIKKYKARLLTLLLD